METTIRLKPSELNLTLINAIKSIYKGYEDIEITINFSGVPSSENKMAITQAEFNKMIEKRAEDIENGTSLVSFTEDEFETLCSKLLHA